RREPRRQRRDDRVPRRAGRRGGRAGAPGGRRGRAAARRHRTRGQAGGGGVVTGSSSETAVVITCYGLGRWLPEALDSVLAQTAPAQEIVVVDDGSTDPLTLQVLDRLERHEPRVRTIRCEHGGAAQARNAG